MVFEDAYTQNDFCWSYERENSAIGIGISIGIGYPSIKAQVCIQIYTNTQPMMDMRGF